MYVGNLPRECSEKDLLDLFSTPERQVAKVSIVTDHKTGRSRGFAFLELASEEDAAAAIEAAQEVQLHGRTLKVGRAFNARMGERTSGPDRSESFRPRGGGNRRGRR